MCAGEADEIYVGLQWLDDEDDDDPPFFIMCDGEQSSILRIQNPPRVFSLQTHDIDGRL